MAKRHELAGVAASSRRNSRARSMGKACVEALEGRVLLAVTAGEYDAIRSSYPGFNLPADMASVNIIEISPSQLSVANLKSAITAAGSTALPDLVVLRTTDTQNSIAYASGGDTVSIDIPSTQGAISMVGFGSEPLTIDAANQSRVISVGSAASTTTVNLGGMTLTRSYTSSGYGGGVYQCYGTLNLTNVTISGNTALYGGGGICTQHGTLTLTNVTISRNTVLLQQYGGGGIYADQSAMTLTNVTITKNTASWEDGGGIYALGGTMTLTNVTISGNAAYSNGGGIYADSGTVILTNVIISENTAYYWGGGISASTDTMILTSVTISGNTASYCGGLYQYSGTLTLRNTVVARNVGSEVRDIFQDSGGTLGGTSNLIGDGSGQTGLANGVGRNLVGTSASPVDPVLAEGGGFGNGMAPLPGSPAIDAGDDSLIPADITTDVYGAARIQGAHVNIGAVETVLSPKPGVTYVVTSLGDGIVADGVLTLREALAAANSNQVVGDAPAGSYSSPDRIEFAPGLTGTILTNGQAYQITGSLTLAGPGVNLMTINAMGSSGVLDIRGLHAVAISGMTLTGGNTSANGGGIFASGVHLTLDQLAIGGNRASWGGGICASGGTTMTLTNVTITGNMASSSANFHWGGGIYASGGTMTLTSVTISENTASGSTYDYGGGIYIDADTMVTLTNVSINKNTATWDGGGIYAYSGTMTLTNVTISGNAAPWGGGIYTSYGTTVTLTNATISGNTASTAGGGIYRSSNLDGVVMYNTVVAWNAGNDLYDAGSAGFSGSNNLIGDGSGQTGLSNGTNGNLVGTSTSPIDPQFVREAGTDCRNWDLRLQATSPAVDAGDNARIPTGVTTDITGGPRIINVTVDMGAYELDQAPTNLLLSSSTIAENQPAGTVVGSFSTADSDAGDTFTYSLVSGAGSTDNAAFQVVGGQFLTAAMFDYETKSSYSIRVRTTDQGGLVFERAFTINVTDVVEGTIAPWRVGHYGGAVQAVQVVGNRAYLAQQDSFSILDISTPATSLHLVASISLPSLAYGVSVVGSYAYVADTKAGLQVIDISNPAAPVRVGGYDTSGYAYGVSVVGSYAYVADANAGLQVIDISNPAAPARVGGYDTSGWAYGVSVVGFYAYVADHGAGLQVIDISNPAAPVRVGGCYTSYAAYGVSVVGSYAYVADYDAGLQVIDISNPAAPVRVGGYDTSGSAEGVSVVGSYAYVADHDAGLQVIDVSNPAAPVRVGGYDTRGYACGVSVVGSYAYVADDYAGLQVIDISNPAAPVRVGGYDTSGNADGVSVVGSYAYVADWSAGLQVIDISNPAAPVRVGGCYTGGYAFGVSVVGSYAYLADYTAGLHVIDISNPAAPVRVGGYRTSGHACGVSVVGSYAYVADDAAGLQVIDISSPAAPVRVGGYDTSGIAYGVSVVGSYAYVADGASGLQVIDISNPAAPARVGGYDTSGIAYGVSVVGSYAYVADGASGLQVIDISNPAAPVRVGGYDTSGSAYDVSVVGSYAYVADDVALQVIDISNPAAPVRVGGCYTSGTAYGVSVVGSYAYVADREAGLQVIRITDQAPTDVQLSGASVAENRPAGTAVGSFSTSDLDAGDSFTYTLVSGTGSMDNGSFSISGNQLLTAAILNYEGKNSYSIRVRATDQGGLWYEKVFTITVTDVDEIAPTVTAVYVRGSTWAAGYLSFLAANTSGSSSTYGYAIPVGSGSSQLQTLPWRNLNRISIAFSEDVSVAQAQLAIVGSVGSYSVSGFSYSAADHVATWSLSAVIGPDKLYVAVPGSGSTPVKDAAGNVLDGEWNNPTSYSQVGSTSSFPSGNGSAGGDFAFRLDVLPGDSTGGSLGKVNVADIAQTKSRSGPPVSISSYRSDFDGNNLVNVADIAYVKSRSGINSLPVNPPVLPVFGVAFSQVSLLLKSRSLTLW